MRVSKSVKIFLGLATAWELIYPLIFLALWFTMFSGIVFMGERGTSSLPAVPTIFMGLFPVHCLTIVLQLGLMTFYLIHVIKNTAAAETPRIVLGVGIFLMPFIAMPVYYYLYIWLDTPPAWALTKPTA